MKNHTELREQDVINWLVEKFAFRLEVPEADVDIDMIFTDFGLDSTEVLVLAGEFEAWLGFELAPTAMWYYPTIRKLSGYIVELHLQQVA